MKKILFSIALALISSTAFAAEFVNFSPDAQNIIDAGMAGKKLQCFLGKSKLDLLQNFNFGLGNSVFIEVREVGQGLDVFLQSPESPEPHSLGLKRLTISNGASFDVSIKDDGFLFFVSKNGNIEIERMIEGENNLETLFVGFCNQVDQIPSESDIVRMGYIFRIHDYCNKTRRCL